MKPHQIQAALEEIGNLKDSTEYASSPGFAQRVDGLEQRVLGEQQRYQQGIKAKVDKSMAGISPVPEPSSVVSLMDKIPLVGSWVEGLSHSNMGSKPMASGGKIVDSPEIPEDLRTGMNLAGKQAVGTIAALGQSIPTLTTALEAPGEGLARLAPSWRSGIEKVLPTRGYYENKVEEAPFSTVARTAGWGLGTALTGGMNLVGHGMLQAVKPAARGIERVIEPLTGGVMRNVAGKTPGFFRTVAAGGAQGLANATAETAVRAATDAPAAIAGQTPMQAPSRNEIALPTAIGVLSSVIPGMGNWASNPNTRTGQTANTWAVNQRRGRHAPEGDLGRLSEGKEGVVEARQLGREGIAGAKELGKEKLGRFNEAAAKEMGSQKDAARARIEDESLLRAQPIEQDLREELRGIDRVKASKEVEFAAQKGQAAAEIEPQIASKMATFENSADQALANVKNQLAGDPQEFFRLNQALKNIVSKKARVGTGSAQTVESETGLFDPSGTPIKAQKQVQSQEVLTPQGRALKDIHDEAEAYLQGSGTVQDGLNFLSWLKTKATSGTPESRYPAMQMIGELRKHMADPAFGGKADLGKAWKDWHESIGKLEDAHQIIYGEDMQKAGGRTGKTREDVPDPESDVKYGATPQAGQRGREFLLGLEDQTSKAAMARTPNLGKLTEAGFGQEIQKMQSRLAEINENLRLHGAKYEEAAALAKTEMKQRLHEMNRQVEAQEMAPVQAREQGLAKGRKNIESATQESIADAEMAARDLERGKVAQEESRIGQFKRLAGPALHTAVGATYKSMPHKIAAVGQGLSRLLGATGQMTASRANYMLPNAEAMMSVLPTMQSLTVAKDSHQTSDNMVQAAKEHSKRAKNYTTQLPGRLTSSIGEMLNFKKKDEK